MALPPIQGKSASESYVTKVVKAAVDLVRKTAVVAVYTLIASAHVLEAPISCIFSRQRARLNLTCAKVAMYALKTYVEGAVRFDFHHLSYGMAFILLPGRPCTFGKWMTFDSLVNYDQALLFKYYKEGGDHDLHYLFQKNVDGSYRHLPEEQATPQKDSRGVTIPIDGELSQVSEISVDGKVAHAFPSDGLFVNNAIEFLKEMFYLKGQPTYLQAVSQKTNELIDQVVQPYLEQQKQERQQLPITIDFNLFK